MSNCKKSGNVSAVSTNEDTSATCYNGFKNTEASSFTQISSEFLVTKNSNETEKENCNNVNVRNNRIGDNFDSKRMHISNRVHQNTGLANNSSSNFQKITTKKSTEFIQPETEQKDKFVLPTINKTRKFNNFDHMQFTS